MAEPAVRERYRRRVVILLVLQLTWT